MFEHFDSRTAAVWEEEDLEELFEDIELAGAFESWSVTAAEEPSDSPVPFTITYESRAAKGPVTFEGSMVMSLNEEGEWKADWSDELFFGGDEGMTFSTRWRWPERASIVDRKGRPLARGMRSYPYGSLAGTAIGHLEPLSRKDLRAEPDPMRRVGDLVGGSGLEEAYEDTLAGRPGGTLLLDDGTGKPEVLGRTSARQGEKVKTTIDIDVQRATAAAYGGTTGGAVVLDPRTGDILAAVSSSSFSPGSYVGVAGIEPFDRAVSGLYPPGSSLKVMTAAAGLETGEVTATTELRGPDEYKGVRNFESGEFGTLTFARALQFSVNTAFAQVAERIGARRLTEFAEAFGFNRPPAMALGAAQSSFPPPEDEGDLLWGSIGQAQVLATPLHMATIAGTIANDGERMEPLIDRAESPSGERVVSKKTANVLTGLMENVVVGGTGQGARISGLRVAGKTGTAEVSVDGEIQNHAWFICFAPADDPRIAVAVVAELGGIGGRVAAPLAAGILQRVLPLVK